MSINLDIASSFVVYILPPMRPLEDFLLELGVAKNKTQGAKKQSLRFLKLKTSAKSVQTTAEVCADYMCSLYRLQLKSPESTTYLQI